jgi:hypothetical protein
MTTIPELMRHRTYGIHGESISTPLLHLFVVQCRLMSRAWTHLSAPGYAERAVWAQSAAYDGLPLTGEDKIGGETVRTDPYSHFPAFCAHLLLLLHLFSSMIFGKRPPPWPLSFLPHGSR